MRVPNGVHIARPWRIHEVAGGFRLEDVWALPTPGGPDDFPRLVERFASGEESPSAGSCAARLLWAIRWRLGALLGWDRPTGALPTVRDALPADLRDAPRGPAFAALPFTPVYLLEDEFAAEIVNRTVHGILHLGWVPDGSGGFRGEMAVYVRPDGRLGEAYMAAIKPFRYAIVYPALMRDIAREWPRVRAAPAVAR